MTEDIRDIRGPIVEAAGTAWWPYVVAGAVVIAVAIAVVAYVRRRRRPRSPEDQALAELAATRPLIEAGDGHTVSVRVSQAVRTYVERAFDVHAPRRTTEELLTDLLEEDGPIIAYRDELVSFLEICDLAKYARHALSRPDMTRMVDRAQAFVRATAAPHGGS